MAEARIPALVPTQFRHLAQSAERLPSNANMSRTFCLGAHHGVGHYQLQVYLNEFTFRFNRHRTPMAVFSILIGLSTQHPPITYNQLYTAESVGRQNARYYYMTRRLVGAGGGTTVPLETLIGPIGLVATTRSSNKTSYGVPTSL